MTNHIEISNAGKLLKALKPLLAMADKSPAMVVKVIVKDDKITADAIDKQRVAVNYLTADVSEMKQYGLIVENKSPFVLKDGTYIICLRELRDKLKTFGSKPIAIDADSEREGSPVHLSDGTAELLLTMYSNTDKDAPKVKMTYDLGSYEVETKALTACLNIARALTAYLNIARKDATDTVVRAVSEPFTDTEKALSLVMLDKYREQTLGRYEVHSKECFFEAASYYTVALLYRSVSAIPSPYFRFAFDREFPCCLTSEYLGITNRTLIAPKIYED